MLDALITLMTTTALLLGSPGPAPLSLAATGATFGTQKGLPFLFGILIGLSGVIVGTASGVAAVLAGWPQLRIAVQLLGASYICFVAYKIAFAPVLSPDQLSRSEPPGLLDGIVFNLLNPKAYAAFLAIFSQLTLPLQDPALALLLTGAVCLAVAALVDFAWLRAGGALRPIFEQAIAARFLRVGFALAMMAAVAHAFVI